MVGAALNQQRLFISMQDHQKDDENSPERYNYCQEQVTTFLPQPIVWKKQDESMRTDWLSDAWP